MKKSRLNLLLCFLVAAIIGLAPVAFAEETKPAVAKDAVAQQKTEAMDDEERLDEALNKFGHVSGQAFQCLEEKDRAAGQRKALDIANGILRLFGSDRAFFFAAAFGAGMSSEMDKTKCLETITQYKDMLSKLKALAQK
jgi:hypothetical protein